MLLLCDESSVLPLKMIFQNVLDTGVYPSSWKLANVIPVHKKKDKQLVENYRPISLLPIFSKILEKLMYTRMINLLKNITLCIRINMVLKEVCLLNML